MNPPLLPVTIGLSGGVDSSVAALLLQRRGYWVRGVFMKNWEEDDTTGSCPAAQDFQDARSVAQTLGIPLQGVNFADLYWERVFSHFLTEYQAGRTPNPDVLCNQEIKFKAFLEHALARGAEYIATGHYARIAEVDGEWRLRKARDEAKDQSYFLYTLGQQALARTLFPLGELTKPTVRWLAANAGLTTHSKRDSTGICFIGERPFREFLSRYLPAQPGPIVTPTGDVVGQHGGLWYYTLGQRQGLGLGGRAGDSGEPWYVVAKQLENNTLVVARGEHPWLYRRTLWAVNLHWVSGHPPMFPWQGHAKTRYRQADQGCQITDASPDRLQVTFSQLQRAVTPGQSVVFYQGDNCLGGGIIEETGEPPPELP